MTNVILDKQQHKNIKVQTNTALVSEGANSLPVLADELRQLVIDFPVALIKSNQTERFSMQALLGLEQGENLYLKEDEWQVPYQPMHLMRQPFMVGITGEEGDKPSQENTVITIDNQSPLVAEEGELLFAEDGTPTPFLKQKSQIAFALVGAMERTDLFLQAIEREALITPIKVKVALANGEEKLIEGIYSIDEQKLATLSGGVLNDFHQKGYLSACHYLIAAMGNVQKLVAFKNKQLT